MTNNHFNKSYLIACFIIVFFELIGCGQSITADNMGTGGPSATVLEHTTNDSNNTNDSGPKPLDNTDSTTATSLRKGALVLLHAPGMGFAQTNPYQATRDRPRTGQYPLQCEGSFPNNGNDARKTSYWLWLENASSQSIGGPLPDGVPAPSFGHLSRRLEDAGYGNIKVSHDKNMLANMIMQGPLVIVTASKGINEVIEVANQNQYQGSLILINGATLPVETTGIITTQLKSLVLTHGLYDTINSGQRTDTANLQKLIPVNIPYFIYENRYDGHNPRSLAFPSKVQLINDSWPASCLRRSPSWPYNNSPGGNHRLENTNSYLADLLDAVIIDNADWPKKLIPKLDMDTLNVSKTWQDGLAGIRPAH